MTRLSISDEVRALLSTDVVERMIAQREHTELTCSGCGGTISPEALDVVSVIVRFDLGGTMIAQYAHETCAPSHVDHETTLVAPVRGLGLIYLPMLRGHRIAPAVLVWEPSGTAMDAATGGTLNVAFYRELGFASSDGGVGQIIGPVLGGWVLTSVDGGDLVLRHQGVVLEQFDGIKDTAPAGWLDAARNQRRCLLVVGESLGLERPSVDRIDALLADGRAVAAIVLATKIAR